MSAEIPSLAAERARRDALRAAKQEPLKSSGGGGTSDGMEARIKRLEEDGKELRQDLKTIMRDLSEIKGRVNAMPTTWQMVGFIVALCVAFFTYIRFGLGLGG
ncbi:hypothetical protein [Devosia submarina]|uniref:hypothetical protein n=1 Tax=Devosia submarina TaxID=1173082 RepID=UPI000D36D768|nr:hypothetical protein [Devosia submarina]